MRVIEDNNTQPAKQEASETVCTLLTDERPACDRW